MKALPRFALVCGFLVPITGCGDDGRPKLITVTGTIRLNGEPLPDALIYFMPEEGNPIMRPSRAKTDAQGNFRPGTYNHEDGIPIGHYKIGIAKWEFVGELPTGNDSEISGVSRLKQRWITPKELANPETSGLEARVTRSGLKPAVFELN